MPSADLLHHFQVCWRQPLCSHSPESTIVDLSGSLPRHLRDTGQWAGAEHKSTLCSLLMACSRLPAPEFSISYGAPCPRCCRTNGTSSLD